MDARATTSKRITWMYPNATDSAAVFSDSLTKYVFQHFDGNLTGTPAFVSQSGALIKIMANLLDFVPSTATTLVIHAGTKDLVFCTPCAALDSLRRLFDVISKEHPTIKSLYVSLVLQRSTNRRRHSYNQSFIRNFNLRAHQFNTLVRDYCRHSWLVYFLDHCFHDFPPNRVLAAHGRHLSFEGTAVFACHLRQLFISRLSDTASSCCTSIPSDPSTSMKENSVTKDNPSAGLLSSRLDLATGPPLDCPSSQRNSGPCGLANQIKENASFTKLTRNKLSPDTRTLNACRPIRRNSWCSYS
ncbi:hypothetical protein HPB48_004246 [Haemaphysalis longicornis]|uniref:Uncharacterized protein n=1 Tax=Haemaphysalis longicornis TaxID=44386 RepID=A0A9J6FMK8_HAELO|nr:hypothetical protein HPB48_004246 [Haemaphysalis longicornis]